MASQNSNDFSSPQEAIEGYLEALLQDVADYDIPDDNKSDLANDQDKTDLSIPPESTEKTLPEDRGNYSSSRLSSESQSDYDENGRVQTSEVELDASDSFSRNAFSDHASVEPVSVTADITDSVPFAYKDEQTVLMPEIQVAEELSGSSSDFAEEAFHHESDEDALQTVPAMESDEEPEVAQEILADSGEIDETGEEDVTQDLSSVESKNWINGRPDWAQDRFECLLFKVKGLTLAVPLAELGGIHKKEKDLTPLFGQPGWFLGIMRNNQMNIGIVDTAQWVMPEYINGSHSTDYRFAIHIHNSEWGLGCDEVAEAISLDPDEVKWRTSLGRRPWLAGTVVGHMCALIDVAAFARLLDSDKVPVDLQALDMDEDE